jgi:hypothetical protein
LAKYLWISGRGGLVRTRRTVRAGGSKSRDKTGDIRLSPQIKVKNFGVSARVGSPLKNRGGVKKERGVNIDKIYNTYFAGGVKLN